MTSNGDLQWEKSLGGSGNDYENSAEQTTDGGYILAGVSNSSDGDVTGNHGDYDFWIVKLAPDIADVAPITNRLRSVESYPNPFSFSTRITAPATKQVHICNELGAEVAKLSESAPGEFMWTPDASFPTGMYFVFSDDQRVQVKPLTLLR